MIVEENGMSPGDEIVRDTDYDALSSRVSAYMKGYLPMDPQVMELTSELLRYNIMALNEGYSKIAATRKLKKQFFNLFLSDKDNSKSKQNHHVNSTIRSNHVNSMPYAPIVPSRGHSYQSCHHQFPIAKNGFTQFKSPLINRGTYLRTQVITDEINKFLDANVNQQVQVVSLGAGNDTRPFQLIPQHPNLQYFEFDFEETTRLKRLAVLSSEKLKHSVNIEEEFNLPETRSEILDSPTFLNTDQYHLIPLDLRLLDKDKEIKDIEILNQSQFDVHKPTLIISECCLCYLTQLDADLVIEFWYRNLKRGRFVMYEPIGNPEIKSRYGEVMVKNLSTRGIQMPTLMIYGTIQAQIDRFNTLCPSSKIWCQDMKWVSQYMIDEKENERTSKLEMLDEIEELNLINSHYCLILVEWGI